MFEEQKLSLTKNVQVVYQRVQSTYWQNIKKKKRKIRYPPCFVVQSVSMFWFSPPAGITGLPAPLQTRKGGKLASQSGQVRIVSSEAPPPFHVGQLQRKQQLARHVQFKPHFRPQPGHKIIQNYIQIFHKFFKYQGKPVLSLEFRSIHVSNSFETFVCVHLSAYFGRLTTGKSALVKSL